MKADPYLGLCKTVIEIIKVKADPANEDEPLSIFIFVGADVVDPPFALGELREKFVRRCGFGHEKMLHTSRIYATRINVRKGEFPVYVRRSELVIM